MGCVRGKVGCRRWWGGGDGGEQDAWHRARCRKEILGCRRQQEGCSHAEQGEGANKVQELGENRVQDGKQSIGGEKWGAGCRRW